MNKPNNKWIIFSLVAIGVFMSTLDSSIVNLALPVIMNDFKVPLATIEWVPMIYLLTVSSLLLTFGRISDIKGRRCVYCLGFLIFSIGSLLCGTAVSANWLIIFRSVQGVGAAMLMACSPALVVDIFPASERGKALGILGTAVAAGLTTGPALGGMLLKFFSWPVIFYINIPIGIVSTITAYNLLKRLEEKTYIASRESFDWPGAILIIICFCTFMTGLSHAYDWGYTSTRTLIFFSISTISALSLIVIEIKTLHPIFEPGLFKIRLFILPILSAVFLFMSMFMMILIMPFYLVHPAGFDMIKVGCIMITPFVFLFFVSPISGAVSDRIKSRMLCTLGMTVLMAGLFYLSCLTSSASVFSIVWRLAIVGIGIGIFISPNSLAAMTAVSGKYRGIASGTVATARNLGMVIGIALAGLIFNTIFQKFSGMPGLKTYYPELKVFFMTAFQYTMFAGSMIAGIGIIISFLRGYE
ncbi:MFS transporter [Candidatus Magnetomoraceae bacterium gMMP-15]